MKIRLTRKLVSVVLAGALSTTILSVPRKVGEKESTVTREGLYIEEIYNNESTQGVEEQIIMPLNNQEEIIDETEEVIEEINEIEENKEIELFYYVKALDNSKIYSETTEDSKKQVGLLIKGESLPFVCEMSDNWYEVFYDNQSAYIKNDNLEIIKSYDLVSKVPTFNSIEEAESYLNVSDYVIATADVNIRKEPNTKCKKYELLNKGKTLPLIERYNDEWYKVKYGDKEAYVYAEYVKEIKGYTPKTEMTDMVYTTSQTTLYDINTKEKLHSIPKRETVEVYAMNDEYYLASFDGVVGFVDKKYAESLGDNYVIIDISSQNLKVYVDDKLIIDTPVVTGKDSTPTYCGLFYVFKRGEKIYWKEFDVTVNYGLDFNRGIWIHDASWRKKFGGNIYHKDGSHGCVNVPKKEMPKIYNNVELGTPVLVKK